MLAQPGTPVAVSRTGALTVHGAKIPGGVDIRRTVALHADPLVSHEDIHRGGTMQQRGDIVVERLTGKRAIVIHVNSPDEVTCRFADGRLEDRYTFELDPVLPLLGSILSFVIALFVNGSRDRPGSVAEQVRPLLLRRAAS